MPEEQVISIAEKIKQLIKTKNLPNWLNANLNLSTRGKGAVQYDLLPYVNDLHNVYNEISKRILKELIAHNKVKISASLHIESTWTVLTYENGFHRIHRHNFNNDIASVLYLSLSETTFYKPATFYAIINNVVEEIQPKLGDLYIFPVHLLHGTYPQGKGIRHTLNIDFRYKS